MTIAARVVHLVVFLSSAIELVYEVLWARRFAAIFGATAASSAIALAAVFLGMALGSAATGALAHRWRRPLRALAVLELAMTGSAALLEPILRLYDRLLPSIYPWLSSHGGTGSALQAGLAFLAVAAPAFCMGGTLPLAGQALAGSANRGSQPLAALYLASLAGAVVGTVLVPTVLLPLAGAGGGYAAALGANALAAGLAWLADRRQDESVAVAAVAAAAAGRGSPPFAGVAPWQRDLLAFLSGLGVVALQVLWSRMLSMVHENSVYSFAAALAVFLAGLAGAAALARWVGRSPRAGRWAAGAWIAAGLFVVASPRWFQAASAGMAYTPGTAWSAVPGWGVALMAALLLPGPLLAGVLLPLLLESARSEERVAAALGRCLAANTAGAVLGPLLAAFVVGPAIGLWWSLVAVGAMLVAGGVAAGRLRWRGEPPRGPRAWELAAPAALAAAVALVRPWDIPRVRLDAVRGQRLVRLLEGVHGTVAVLDDGQSRVLTLNNHYTIGGTASAGDERLQGHLPLLLHPAPRQAAFLGLGTGITAGAAMSHRLEQVVVVEIVPEIAAAARDEFGFANQELLRSPRVEIIVGDARAFLRCSGRRFDVIVGDLVTPWRPGEASLYSREHFAAARGALATGGLFCQWLPAFQLTEEAFAIVLGTFLDVFPGATLWKGDFLPHQAAVALIGAPDARALDPATPALRWSAVVPDLDLRVTPYLADPAGIWLYLVGPLDARSPRLARAPRTSDARPWLELAAPFTQGRGAGPGVGPFVGARLEAFLDEVMEAPLDGTWLERLPASALRHREAGALLWRASRLAQEGRRDESALLARRALASLPERLQLAVVGEVVKE